MALLDIQGLDPVRDKGGCDDGSDLSAILCDIDNDY